MILFTFFINCMARYNYQKKDHSLLSPVFQHYLVAPLVSIIPWGIPANIITILANLFLYLALYFVLDAHLLGRANFIVIPALLLLYLVSKGLDGAQARKTNTETPLGEFWSHFLGTFENGIVLYIMFTFFQVDNVLLFVIALLFNYLSEMAMYYEQYKTGWLVWDHIHALEKIGLTVLLMVVSSIDVLYQFLIGDRFSSLSLFELFLALVALSGLITFVKTITRSTNLTYGIWLFVLLLVIVSFFSAFLYSPLGVVIIITLYSCLYIGKLLRAHLVDGVERSPGIFTPLFLLIVFFTDDFFDVNTIYIITLYLLVNIVLLAFYTSKALKDHWIWTNPIPAKKRRKTKPKGRIKP